MINYYKLLEIANFSDISEVKIAYRKKAKEFHPDLYDKNKAKEYEEIFKWINLANATLSNTTAKLAYDQKLRAAFTVEAIPYIQKKKKKYNKEDLYAFAEREKKAEIHNFNSKNSQFSYTNRIILATISVIIGLYFCYENWFSTLDTFANVIIMIGFILFFLSSLFLTQLVYRKLRVTSFNKKGYYQFYESISVYGFTLIMIIGPLLVISCANMKKYYHLQNYGKEVIAEIIHDGSPGITYQFTTIRNETILKNQTAPDNPKVSADNSWILIQYSTKDPRIAKIVISDYPLESPLK